LPFPPQPAAQGPKSLIRCYNRESRWRQ